MKYNIQSKETTYKNVLFRSRLEAKWACFFDLVGWEWAYESCEINGYNPDFILRCSSDSYKTNTIIVEVKPSVFLTNEEIDIICKKYNTVNAHLLILTDMPFYSNKDYETLSIGIGHQNIHDYETHDDLYDLEMKCLNDFGSNYIHFDGMVYGKIERKRFIDYNSQEAEQIKFLWNKAGNITRFNYNNNDF